jgi:hypothetical protein
MMPTSAQLQMSCHWPGGGRLTTVTGIEVGHLMNVSKANYLRVGIANWASGFCVLELSGSLVTPTLIPMRPDGSFAYGKPALALDGCLNISQNSIIDP